MVTRTYLRPRKSCDLALTEQIHMLLVDCHSPSACIAWPTNDAMNVQRSLTQKTIPYPFKGLIQKTLLEAKINYLHSACDIFSISPALPCKTLLAFWVCLLGYPASLFLRGSTYPLVMGLNKVVNIMLFSPAHTLLKFTWKFQQLLIVLCSCRIPHVPVKNLPAPWSPSLLEGFWWVIYIKSCKA